LILFGGIKKLISNEYFGNKKKSYSIIFLKKTSMPNFDFRSEKVKGDMVVSINWLKKQFNCSVNCHPQN
jgi:hypothetical protein